MGIVGERRHGDPGESSNLCSHGLVKAEVGGGGAAQAAKLRKREEARVEERTARFSPELPLPTVAKRVGLCHTALGHGVPFGAAEMNSLWWNFLLICLLPCPHTAPK